MSIANITKCNFSFLRWGLRRQSRKNFLFNFFCSAIAYARSLYARAYVDAYNMSHVLVDFFVLSSVLLLVYAYVASENQAKTGNRNMK